MSMKEVNKLCAEMMRDQTETGKYRIEQVKKFGVHIFAGKPLKCLICGMLFEDVKKTCKKIPIKIYHSKHDQFGFETHGYDGCKKEVKK